MPSLFLYWQKHKYEFSVTNWQTEGIKAAVHSSMYIEDNKGVTAMRKYILMIFAAMLLCMIPTIVLFAIFQDKLMDIQIGGGIKG